MTFIIAYVIRLKLYAAGAVNNGIIWLRHIGCDYLVVYGDVNHVVIWLCIVT
jgi:hypothetical protein